MVNLRQRLAELTERIHMEADAHMAEDWWGFGDWHEAGGCWSGWQWDQPGAGVQAQRSGGETAALGMEVENLRGAMLGLQQGQADVQAGLAAMMGGAAQHGCGGDGFAAGSCVDAEPVQTEPRAADESVRVGNAKSVPLEGGRPESGSPWRKVLADRGQRGRVDCWRSRERTAATAAPAWGACESPYHSIQWMNERGTQKSCGKAGLFSCFVSFVGVGNPKSAGGLATCAALSVPLKEVTRRTLEEMARNPVDSGIPAEMCKLVVFTDDGAALRPCEGVASWGFVVVLMCGNEAFACDWLCVWTGRVGHLPP